SHLTARRSETFDEVRRPAPSGLRFLLEIPDDPPGLMNARFLVALLLFMATPLFEVPQYEVIQISVQDGFNLACLNRGAMILHHSIRMENIRPNLVSPGDVGFLILHLLELCPPACYLQFIELGSEDLHRRLAVAMLRPLILTLYNNARRDMGDAHRRVGYVYVLPTGSRRTIGIDPEILLFNLDLLCIVFNFRSDEDRSK